MRKEEGKLSSVELLLMTCEHKKGYTSSGKDLRNLIPSPNLQKQDYKFLLWSLNLEKKWDFWQNQLGDKYVYTLGPTDQALELILSSIKFKYKIKKPLSSIMTAYGMCSLTDEAYHIDTQTHVEVEGF